MDEDRWVTVSRNDDWSTSRYRHIVRRGFPTSACGTTALPANLWKTNQTKPRCPTCLEKSKQTA